MPLRLKFGRGQITERGVNTLAGIELIEKLPDTRVSTVKIAVLAQIDFLLFNPLPSAIIDSGGGLHAYWLLDIPVMLDDTTRKQTAGILRGLFSALGGDPQYVKSVASVMRLPNSVNINHNVAALL